MIVECMVGLSNWVELVAYVILTNVKRIERKT